MSASFTDQPQKASIKDGKRDLSHLRLTSLNEARDRKKSAGRDGSISQAARMKETSRIKADSQI